jgi:hypothetical protein
LGGESSTRQGDEERDEVGPSQIEQHVEGGKIYGRSSVSYYIRARRHEE